MVLYDSRGAGQRSGVNFDKTMLVDTHVRFEVTVQDQPKPKKPGIALQILHPRFLSLTAREHGHQRRKELANAKRTNCLRYPASCKRRVDKCLKTHQIRPVKSVPSVQSPDRGVAALHISQFPTFSH